MYKSLGKPEVSVDRRMKFEWILWKEDVMCGLDSSVTGQDTQAECCKHDRGPYYTMNSIKFIVSFNSCQILCYSSIFRQISVKYKLLKLDELKA